MFDVSPLFAAALQPVFVNCFHPRGQINFRLFYIQSIPILPILIYISTWDRLQITASVSDVVSAEHVGGAREQLSVMFLPRHR